MVASFGEVQFVMGFVMGKVQTLYSSVLIKTLLITQCNKIWVMSCPWGFDCRTLFVGYQSHRNGLFSAENSLWGREIFFSE